MHFKIYFKKTHSHQYSGYMHITSTHAVHNSSVETALTLYKSYPNSMFKLGRMLAKRHVIFFSKVVVIVYSLKLYDLNMH